METYVNRLYVGKEHQISVTDIELIKLVTVKDFDNFIDRPVRCKHTLVV